MNVIHYPTVICFGVFVEALNFCIEHARWKTDILALL